MATDRKKPSSPLLLARWHHHHHQCGEPDRPARAERVSKRLGPDRRPPSGFACEGRDTRAARTSSFRRHKAGDDDRSWARLGHAPARRRQREARKPEQTQARPRFWLAERRDGPRQCHPRGVASLSAPETEADMGTGPGRRVGVGWGRGHSENPGNTCLRTFSRSARVVLVTKLILVQLS